METSLVKRIASHPGIRFAEMSYETVHCLHCDRGTKVRVGAHHVVS